MRVGAFFNWQNHTDWERYLRQGAETPAIPDHVVYDEDIHLGSLVEPLGFDSYWAIDHYFTPYGMTGGALQNLTYFAGKTSTIEMGTMVVVLPWYEPLKLAHQISVLDNFLQGRRLRLGLGRGASMREFGRLGIPMQEARGRFNECLEVLRKALSQEWFSHDGEFFHIPESSIRPMFRNPERLLEDLRVAWTSPETLPIAANAGLGMLMTNQKSWEDYGQDLRNFNGIRAERGWTPKQPTVVVRATCCETEAEAWDLMSRHVLEGQLSSKYHYQMGEAVMSNIKGYEAYAASPLRTPLTDEQMIEFAGRPQAWGTPDQVYDKLRFIQAMTGADEFVLSFRFGLMPLESAERSMRLFAAEVLPRLHQFQATLAGLDAPDEADSIEVEALKTFSV